ncbi:hypothetical protein L7F22_044384 [Adiantum nelumboides]|nr:hypothetical protein [Adiantum nelumboides]
MGPELMQVNVDKIDIEKVHDIPTIPLEDRDLYTLLYEKASTDRDLYTLLYEKASTPAHDTRGTARRRGRPVVANTSAIVGDVSSSCSEEDDESLEDFEEGSNSSGASG